eukprot:CAMPEP_0181360646 /NCGR_PEP_ID=MMETSP1106-20121128/6789_1 /TAXON_ID=81844 /ORGANISM="Mantoniella antarctica, Strain SL-175" /LENGTH=87 /DNA_ID=CAMNT_0023473957 /DNA_START=28 /DNA_END=288 /DNA_ORIENTATION=-
MSACPRHDAVYSGVDPEFIVARFASDITYDGVEQGYKGARFAFAPCASSVSTTFANSCSEAMCSAVIPLSPAGWFTSAPLPSSISTM